MLSIARDATSQDSSSSRISLAALIDQFGRRYPLAFVGVLAGDDAAHHRAVRVITAAGACCSYFSTMTCQMVLLLLLDGASTFTTNTSQRR